MMLNLSWVGIPLAGAKTLVVSTTGKARGRPLKTLLVSVPRRPNAEGYIEE